MSEDAKKIIATIKQGTLPPLSSAGNSKGTQVLQHGLNLSQFELRTVAKSTPKENK